jgi:hypothetical protein
VSEVNSGLFRTRADLICSYLCFRNMYYTVLYLLTGLASTSNFTYAYCAPSVPSKGTKRDAQGRSLTHVPAGGHHVANAPAGHVQ